MTKIREIKISSEDLKFILGNDYDFFLKKVIPNCFCGYCFDKNTVTIVNYQIYIDRFNGIVLRGFCKDCGGKVVRCLESEEVPKYLEKVIEIRKKYV